MSIIDFRFSLDSCTLIPNCYNLCASEFNPKESQILFLRKNCLAAVNSPKCVPPVELPFYSIPVFFSNSKWINYLEILESEKKAMTQKFACTIYEYKMWKIEFCIVVAVVVVVVVNCISFFLVLITIKNGKKDKRLSLLSSPFPPFFACYRNFFSLQTKQKMKKTFLHLFTFTQKKGKSLLSQSIVVMVGFDISFWKIKVFR